MTFGGKNRRKSDPKESRYNSERKTTMIQLGESTPIKLGFAFSLLMVLGGAVWWASALETRAGVVEDTSSETKKILSNMSENMTKGMESVSKELRGTRESLMTLMHKQSLMLERTQIQIQTLQNRTDKIEERQIKILKESAK